MNLIETTSGMQGRLIVAGRGLLGLMQQDLMTGTGLSRQTILNLENAKGNPTIKSLNATVKFLNDGGVEFSESPTHYIVALRKPLAE